MSVRHAILGLIAQKPRYGYELRAAFEALVGGDENWDVKPAQIYATLERLEEAKLIACISDLGEGDEPSRRVYAITSQGQEALTAWLSCGVLPGHQRDEFFVKLMIALISSRVTPERLIQAQRDLLLQALRTAMMQRDACNPRTETAQILLRDKVVMHLETDLRWLDLIEDRLTEMRNQPPPEPVIRGRGRPPKKI